MKYNQHRTPIRCISALVIGLILGTLCFALSMPATLQAQASVTMNINPATTAVEVGDPFRVEVQVVAGTQPVDGAEVHLTFDPDLLHVQSLAAGSHLPTQILPPAFDNEANFLCIEILSQDTWSEPLHLINEGAHMHRQVSPLRFKNIIYYSE